MIYISAVLGHDLPRRGLRGRVNRSTIAGTTHTLSSPVRQSRPIQNGTCARIQVKLHSLLEPFSVPVFHPVRNVHDKWHDLLPCWGVPGMWIFERSHFHIFFLFGLGKDAPQCGTMWKDFRREKWEASLWWGLLWRNVCCDPLEDNSKESFGQRRNKQGLYVLYGHSCKGSTGAGCFQGSLQKPQVIFYDVKGHRTWICTGCLSLVFHWRNR